MPPFSQPTDETHETDSAVVDSGIQGDSSDTDTDTSDVSDSGGSDSGPDTGLSDTADPCQDVPVVTYESFGKGFMTGYCQTCHASTTANRNGAPESVTFDTLKDCWTWSQRILARATGDSPSMPPNGGVEEDERVMLEWWLTCAEEGT